MSADGVLNVSKRYERNGVHAMSCRVCIRWACLLVLSALVSAVLRADDVQITGPYTHENLAIFLIHSPRNQGNRQLLTLQEAIDQKKTVVYETGNVNELSIENVSSERVYLQSGDIVKGGQQDRVLTTDFILPAHSGKIPIASFCVERGRWSKRGTEAADRFEASNQVVAGKSLRMAVREKQAQARIWDQVASTQRELAVATQAGAGGRSGGGSGGGVGTGASSRTDIAGGVVPRSASMQLALESKPVVAATQAYEQNLLKIVGANNDIVGFAYAINGKLSSADAYASNDLFRRMWPKLLKASAVEAVAERPNAKAFSPPDNASVRAALADADLGRTSTTDVTDHTSVVKKETDKLLVFETRERAGGNQWVHKSYIAK